MKKRLLSALLALALVFVLLPTTALAGVTTESDYDISIDGKRYKFDSDGSGGYTTAYYQENNSKTPTSNYEDVWQTNPYLEITRVDNIITITVKIGSKGPGKSVTIGASTQENYECIAVNGTVDLIITGDKGTSLTLNKTHSGAALSATKGNITITDGVKVTASFKNKAVGNYVFYAIWAKNLTVSGANTEVTASGNCEDAIHVSGTVTVSKGAKLTATNDHNDRYKPYPITKSSAINSNVLTIADENSCVIAQAIDSLYGKPLRIQNYNIAGAIVKAGSSNYYSTETTIDKIDGNIYVKISIPALEKDSYVYIAGGPAVVGQWTNIPAAATGTGSYYYDADKKELTLKDVNITHSDGAIVQFMAGAPYIIKLEGTNSIKDVNSFIRVPERGYESLDGLSVTISGAGSLEVTARGNAITMLKGDLVFNNTGAITLETNTLNGKAINVSGNISIGNDFNRNLKITAGNDTFDLKYSDFNDLNKYKSISFATPNSTISYDGTTLKQGEIIKGEISGTATVATKGNTITLNNFKGTQALSFDATLADSTLVLEGTNTLSSIVTTQKGLTISGSGSGSLTVGSIKVTNNDNIRADLTITDGAHVTVNRPSSEDEPAVEVSGNLTVTGDGTQLSAECTAATNPAIEVGGNASFTGSTVTITNHSTTQGKQYEDSNAASSALHVNGAVTISGGTVTAEAKAGGNAIRAVGNITVSNDATVTAKNNSQYFSAITAGGATGGEVKTLHNLIVSGENTRITATNTHDNNLTYGGAINAYIKNANEGHYLQVGTDTKAIAPNVNTTVRNNSLTITRGDKVTRTNSPVVIAGTTLLNDTFYTINGSTVAEGTESNYNAFYSSTTKTLKLNNASINGAGTNKAIEANVGGYTFTIELVGNNIIKTSGFANNVIDITGNLYFTGSGTAEVSGKGTPIYATYKIDVSADVTITNTEKAGSFTFSAYGENSSNYKGANTFAIGTGYTAYATTDKTTWAVYDNTTASENESYTTLRITTQPPETGGGSTHQHTYDQSAWKSDATHHWQECTDPNCPDPTKGITNKASHSFSNGTCTICGYRGQTEEHHFGTEWISDAEYHWHECTDKGCNAISGKAPHEWTGWRIDEPSPGMHNRFCNCGYNDYSHHYNLVYAAAGEAGHYQYCTHGNCTFKTSTVPHKYDGDTCTICNYTKSGEIVPPTPDNPGTIVIIRPAEEEKPAQQPNPSTGANDLVGLAVAAAVAAALGSAALLRKHD